MPESIYHPSPEDISRIKIHKEKLKVSGDGIFPTLQGEGINAGAPVVFVRLHLCNLACGRNGGWKCDTWYTWDKNTREFWQESKDMGPADVARDVQKAWEHEHTPNDDYRMVISGGEPLLQQEQLAILLSFLPDWKVEIETNGTIKPIPELADCQFNCSPKLANSGNTKNRRYRPEVVKAMAKLPNSWFKFVVTSPADLIEVKDMVRECEIPATKVLIMPEGNSVEVVDKRLKLLKAEVASLGWLTTDRHHLRWFGNKRRT